MPEKEGQRLRIVALLNVLWGYYPDERLGQLLENTLGDEKSLFYASDERLEKSLLEEIEHCKNEGMAWEGPL